jgi:hypothetical protein
MDYLISEGYPGAAEKFANETNFFHGEAFDVESIRERVQIRNAILNGHIEEAIELLNNNETLVSFIALQLPPYMIILVSCTTRNLLREALDELNTDLQSSV